MCLEPNSKLQCLPEACGALLLHTAGSPHNIGQVSTTYRHPLGGHGVDASLVTKRKPLERNYLTGVTIPACLHTCLAQCLPQLGVCQTQTRPALHFVGPVHELPPHCSPSARPMGDSSVEKPRSLARIPLSLSNLVTSSLNSSLDLVTSSLNSAAAALHQKTHISA